MNMRVIPCSTADEFISKLRPESEYWQNSVRGRWVFRGQANHAFDLVPKALRADNDWLHTKANQKGPYLKWQDQVDAELDLIWEFFNLADEIGLAIPCDCPEFRIQKGFAVYKARASIKYPPNELLPLMALAQHHGVPTRLLDFSYDPLVAAFFAAHLAIEIDPDTNVITYKYRDSSISVWAIDLNFVEYEWPYQENPKAMIKKLTVPRFSNPFLHQQSGLFLYDDFELAYYIGHGTRNSLNESIKQAADKPRVNRPVMLKFEVPCTEALHVLKLLEKDQITKAHLMPSYDNVTQMLNILPLLR